MDIQPLGDLAIRICFGEGINKAIHQRVRHFISRLKVANITGIIEWVPAYNTVAIYYRPEMISFKKLVEAVEKIYHTPDGLEPLQPLVYKIPVYYGGETGQDLSYIARYHQMSEDEVIALHAAKEYLIYMVGFVPGFPYLGGLSSRLAVPRLEHPRSSVPAGSVGIGGNQTGIYPSKVPSGWRIVGITPVQLFDIDDPTPNLLALGDYIKFFPIDWDQYQKIKNLVDEKKYKLSSYFKKEG